MKVSRKKSIKALLSMAEALSKHSRHLGGLRDQREFGRWLAAPGAGKVGAVSQAEQFATTVPFSRRQVAYVFDRVGVDVGKALLRLCAVGVVDPGIIPLTTQEPCHLHNLFRDSKDFWNSCRRGGCSLA